MRPRIINRKILTDFLQATKASIKLELDKKPLTITYENALAAFRNQVNHKFPPELSSSNSISTKRINKARTCGGVIGGIFQVRCGRYKVHGGRGRYGGGNGGRGNHRRSRQDD